MPRGVAMYFWLVTRETVDSCRPNIGNFAKHQRPHRHLAMFEKLALALDDGLRHTMNGIETLLDILDQPARLLQLATQIAVAPALLG